MILNHIEGKYPPKCQTQGRLKSGGARWVEATGTEAARDIVALSFRNGSGNGWS